ncbi:MAG TPA: pseudouridine synthase [Clostridia bacterium]|jgi:23S rRNA pseudouridine2605 synthase|nr:pseudouridine synthase [Clostridia bacterium]
MRLNKYISTSGLCSRRKADELISNKKVKVNGEIVIDFGFKVDLTYDVVSVDNIYLHSKTNQQNVYLMFNKPKGCVCTAQDEKGRQTIYDFINSPYRLFSIGRLDYNTEGLLILTNDGDITHKLSHPTFEVTKTYIARINGSITDSELQLLRNGVLIDNGYKTKPASFKIINKTNTTTTIEVVIKEGKNRQIHKMFNSINKNVVSLKRVAFGPLQLSNVARGKYRELNRNEIKLLKNYIKGENNENFNRK